MAKSDVVAKAREFIRSEFQTNPEKRQRNVALIRSVALFVGSIIFMRQYGELMVA
eukprot:CAMPEP_0198236366 /NCGR_PEP_ID=MMETSP1446-20131203/2255_1 /TAXON_ID=1461542 ORGANISM="Unidentified sp, Strain CCMP2111" /NCGR_SAMPLE_ID=MMETSP1446 /ASSEMBLY_ACC=CAM_ASM_001112 /LENGTH=54 /DNA_ID=CAMNT_0043918077 /DNA_START=48 /DNA_END=212 /DNA_ORIENTATION=-